MNGSSGRGVGSGKRGDFFLERYLRLPTPVLRCFSSGVRAIKFMNSGDSLLLRTVRLAVFLCFFAGVLWPHSGLASWTHSEPGLTVGFSEVLGDKLSGGFFVLSLELKNTTPADVPLQLNVTFAGRSHASGGSVWTQIQVPPGSRSRQVILPAPYADGFGSRIQVESIGPAGRFLHHLHAYRGGNDGTAPFAVAGAKYEQFAGELGKVFGGPHATWTHSPPPLALRFEGQVPLEKRTSVGSFPDFASLPHESRGFGSVTGLWVHHSDWNAAAAPLRRAVRDWVRAGGRLFVMAKERTALADLPENLGALGLGRVALDEPLEPGRLKEFSVKVLGLDDSPFPGRMEDYAGWKSRLLPPFELHIRVLLGLLLGFLILLLPVNLLWLAPVHKRHRLFVTVPAISLVAGLGLGAVVLLTDGRGGVGIRNGLVLVGGGKENTFLYQEQLSRTGMVSSTRFGLPEDVAFVICKMDRQDAFRSFRSVEGFSGGWFSSRAIQGHVLQRWGPTSAGVTLRTGTGDAPVLVAEGLGSTGPVFYADKNGDYWTAPKLPAGTPVALVRASAGAFEDWFGRCVFEPSSNLQARMREALHRRDWFFTVAEGAPDFWVPTLPQVRWVRDQMVYLGPVRREEAL